MRTLIPAIVMVARFIVTINADRKRYEFCERTIIGQPIEELIDVMVEEISFRSKCMVFVIDAHYKRLVNFHWTRRMRNVVPVYVVTIGDSESLFPPRTQLSYIVGHSKNSGCDGYVILMANPHRVSQFLRYAETERLIDTRGYFLLIHDNRLFDDTTKYLWNRMINVVFLRSMKTIGHTSTSREQYVSTSNHESRFNLETVYYPVRVKTFVLTRYLDTWNRGKFRNGRDHFVTKIDDLRRKTLRIAVFQHVPAVTKLAVKSFHDNYEKSGKIDDELDRAYGIEFELVRMIARTMNFRPKFYAPTNVEIVRWGQPRSNTTEFDGLIGETANGDAAFLIGDLHYTPRNNRHVDLSLPYNTECLTFLTPEALNDNSWKLLIVPFRLYTWIAVILTLILGALIFHLFALTYRKYIIIPETLTSDEKISKDQSASMKMWNSRSHETLRNLELFTEPLNSVMYTYSMLLQVSLPRIPTAWAVRVFIGWWWVYSILVTVAYRASMTATLANPISRVTIDTIAELAKSSIAVGGWMDEQRDLFLSSSDVDVRRIGDRFEITNDEEDAIARVADGTFCYYDNIYVLKEARAIRQRLEYDRTRTATKLDETTKVDRDLHIMQECLIDMPIAVGMDKNSPLKPQVDRIIQRAAEAGFVAKWLSDATEWTKIVELRFKMPPEQTLVNLHKLQGALVALGSGYLASLVALAGEKLHWKYVVQRDPRYDKYQMDLFYARARMK